MRREAGFTLVEVLVGIALFGLIVAALAAGTSYVTAIDRSQSRLLARTGDLDGVERLVRRLIAQANPGAANVTPVQGTADRISFTTFLVLPDAPAGLDADVALLLGADKRIVLRWRPHQPGVAGGAPREIELLRDVAGLFVAYLGEGWRDRWDGPDPPALVRLRITFPAGDARHWPDLVVAPVRRRPG